MDEINYQAIAETLQLENEKLRLLILKIRNERKPLEFDTAWILPFLADHTQVLSIAVMFSLLLLAFTDFCFRFLRRNNHA